MHSWSQQQRQESGKVLLSAGANRGLVVSLWLAGRRSLLHDSESWNLSTDKEKYYRRANCVMLQRRAIKWLRWDKFCMNYTLQIATSFRPFQWHMLEIGRAKIIMFCHGILGNRGSGIFPEQEACFSHWRPCFDFKYCWLYTAVTFFRHLFFNSSWILGHREISTADKDSSEAYAITVGGSWSRPSINTGLSHCM